MKKLWEYKPAIERFLEKIKKEKVALDTECWVWGASKNKGGYGWFRGENSKTEIGYKGRLAHRWSYEHFVEKIRDGYEIDHICRNRACVNPEHLRQVMHVENMHNNKNIPKKILFCKNGHQYTVENVYIRTRPDGRSYRACRLCKRLNEKKLYNGTTKHTS